MFALSTFPTLDRMLSLNRALDEAVASSWNGSNGHAWVPALDIVERQDAYVLALEVPGVDPSTIDVSFEKSLLTVRGERATVETQKDDNVRVMERVTGSFLRSVRLPEHVDGDRISAESKDGVLYLTVPKAQSAKARKIQIKGVEQKQIG